MRKPLRPRQRLGKYKIVRRLASGGFAEVYLAVDTLEGVRVALKVPFEDMRDARHLEEFRREVLIASRFDCPEILPVKNADVIDGVFVVAALLGKESLAERLDRPLRAPEALDMFGQLLSAVAHAHEARVIHRDLKPGNVILFDGGRVRLTDFGISRVALKTVSASGSGTIGYMAPEQALGRPTFRSDVFSLGLILWEMLSGHVPVWPFEWPPKGIDRVRRKASEELIALVERSLRVDQRRRFPNAVAMLSAWERLESRRRLLRPKDRTRRPTERNGSDWQEARLRQFKREFRGQLKLTHACRRCEGPMSEPMRACPWCGARHKVHRGDTDFPARCSRCRRGRKHDWKSCAWCYGPGFRKVADRAYNDARYTRRCTACKGGLMPFMSYCPWCRVKVRRAWSLEGGGGRCGRCGWGVAKGYWSTCPWCATSLARNG